MSQQIGEGGMMIATPKTLRPEERILLTFHSPDGKIVITQGTLVYQVPNATRSEVERFGVEFQGVDYGLKRAIRNYVAAKSGDDY